MYRPKNVSSHEVLHLGWLWDIELAKVMEVYWAELLRNFLVFLIKRGRVSWHGPFALCSLPFAFPFCSFSSLEQQWKGWRLGSYFVTTGMKFLSSGW